MFGKRKMYLDYNTIFTLNLEITERHEKINIAGSFSSSLPQLLLQLYLSLDK